MKAEKAKVKAAKPKAKTSKAKPLASVTPIAKNVSPAVDQTVASSLVVDPALTKQTQLLKFTSETLKVETVADATRANEMLVQLKAAEREVERQRGAVIKPLKDHVKRLELMFRPLTQALDDADKLIRQKVLAYRAKAEQAAQAERARLIEQAEAAQADGDDAQVEALAIQASVLDSGLQKTQAAASGQVQAKLVWKFEVVDLGAVPREYHSLDESKVRAAMRSGIRDIPGIRIFQQEQLAVSDGSGPARGPAALESTNELF